MSSALEQIHTPNLVDSEMLTGTTADMHVDPCGHMQAPSHIGLKSQINDDDKQ